MSIVLPSRAVVITEKTLFDVMRDVWAARRMIAMSVAVFFALAIVFLGLSRAHSRAEMILMPANPMGEFLDAPMPSHEGTIALQGGSQGAVHDLAFLRFENSYFGARVAGILIQNKEILSGLQKDRAFLFSGGFQPQTAQELADYIKKRVKIEPVSGTPLRKLIYLHPDPVFAALFLSHIYAVTDELIRAQTLKEVQARAAYLDEMIAKNPDAEHRRVLTDILMAQERTRMLVSIDQPFSAAIIEPPSTLAKTAWPQAMMILPLFVLLAVLTGFVLHGVRNYGR